MNLILLMLIFFTPPIFSLGDIDALEECGLIIVNFVEVSDELDRYLDELNSLQAERSKREDSSKDEMRCSELNGNIEREVQ